VSEQLRDAAFRAFVWQTIAAKASELKDQARAELAAIPAGEVIAARWGDRLLAKASMGKPRTKLVVTDETVFAKWVAERHPSEVVTQVNPAFIKAIEARAKELGLGAVIDTHGEVIPGVEIQTGEPVVSVRKEKDVDSLSVIAEIMAAGQLSLEVRELTVKPEPTDRWTTDQEAGAIG
jgi:hypothetical protein